MGFRNFTVKDENEQIIAYANSLWLYVDTKNGRLQKVPEDQIKGFSIEPAFPMEELSRKMEIPEGMAEKESFRIQRFHIDSNQHVNNEKYVLMAMEYVPHGAVIRSVQAEYKTAAVLGDTIVPYVNTADDKVTVLLGNEEKKPFAVIAFSIGK